MTVRDMKKAVEEVGLPLGAAPLRVCEKGTQLDIGVLNRWKELPDDYWLSEGEKVRVEVEFSPPLSEEELRDACETAPPEEGYMKITKNRMILELVLPERPEEPVGKLEREAERRRSRWGNVEILGPGKNWWLLGGGLAGVAVFGYVATR